ncbi:Uncharacterised protein [Mycobacteroides abscessus subsp. abscessus]|nr:Uncharacterised protein [Mycobacteroides abscessus subsp. abscessus]
MVGVAMGKVPMVQIPVTSSLRRCPVSSPTIKAGSISRR